MNWSISDLGPLDEAYPAGGLFAAWLTGGPVPGATNAAGELSAALAAPEPASKAPLWTSLPFSEQLPARWRELAAGPGVVVTGQQPGFLGGPLLTLLKIATAVSLAQRRTAAGRPTVPVFWSADDDDDLVEALAPVGWQADGGITVKSAARGRPEQKGSGRPILADLGPEFWGAGAAAEFPQGGDGLQSDLVEVLRKQASAGTTWGQQQHTLIKRLFAGTDLVVIRGNDPDLHAAAAPFYASLAGRLPELADAARQRGAELAAAGFHAQLSERSLSRPLFQAVGGHRQPVADTQGSDPASLRPGVMLRSPVQDWLLAPAAVVVGPGELAYLRQLDPVYAALVLPRSALVPRLSAWVLPDGTAGTRIWNRLLERRDSAGTDPAGQAAAWTAAVVGPVREHLTRLLVAELGVSAQRAGDMADRRARRFAKGVRAMLAAEAARRNRALPPGVPGWVLPDGLRQERSLGVLGALALWGEGLVPAAAAAAELHLTRGLAGAWREIGICLPVDPDTGKELK